MPGYRDALSFTEPEDGCAAEDHPETVEEDGEGEYLLKFLGKVRILIQIAEKTVSETGTLSFRCAAKNTFGRLPSRPWRTSPGDCSVKNHSYASTPVKRKAENSSAACFRRSGRSRHRNFPFAFHLVQSRQYCNSSGSPACTNQ